MAMLPGCFAASQAVAVGDRPAQATVGATDRRFPLEQLTPGVEQVLHGCERVDPRRRKGSSLIAHLSPGGRAFDEDAVGPLADVWFDRGGCAVVRET
jgi:hypothetical protein